MLPAIGAIDAFTRSMDHFLATRLASENDIDVVQFVQTWPNTSRMFSMPGKISGRAMTGAWTTVLTHEGRAHVYCDGKPCYDADHADVVFRSHLDERKLTDLGQARQRYGAKVGS